MERNGDSEHSQRERGNAKSDDGEHYHAGLIDLFPLLDWALLSNVVLGVTVGFGVALRLGDPYMR